MLTDAQERLEIDPFATEARRRPVTAAKRALGDEDRVGTARPCSFTSAPSASAKVAPPSIASTAR